MKISTIRLAAAIACAAITLASCGTSPPDSAATPTPQASNRPSAVGDPIAPPACLDAKFVWADLLNRLLLVGCFDQFDLGSVETIWAWDGEAWELLSDDGPPANVVTGFAWDADRDVLVRYGGIPVTEQSCSTETWEWDTITWRRVEADPPQPCDHIEMAWDASAGRVLMVGGGRGQRLVAGTWSWDGTTWRRVTDAGPAPRAHHGVYAGGRDPRVLLIGGYDGVRVFGDMWTWDGARWEEEIVPGPSRGPGPRSHHGLATGPMGIVVFGGATGTDTFGSLVDETWILEDRGWVEHVGGAGPSARGLPAMGQDPDRSVIVLYGGFDADGNPLGDTWEWDRAWRCVAGCDG